MTYNPHLHHRRSIRLSHWDYAETGAYFITICTLNREMLLGQIHTDRVLLNAAGRIVSDEWMLSVDIRTELQLDAFVVMPNHFHAVAILFRDVGATGSSPLPRIPNGPTPRSLGALVAGLKIASTKRINELRRTPGKAVWQRNYYERILRNEKELERARGYILCNPEVDRGRK